MDGADGDTPGAEGPVLALTKGERAELVAWRAVGMCLDLKAVASQADRYLIGNRKTRITIGTEKPQELAEALFAAVDLMAINMGIPEQPDEPLDGE